ncbi:hypothetical protein AB0K93_26375 [Streptomyces sp. NPDC052676]|uniref:hypothetical protein n=1 Tax=Streptomyces sp. NPDC052676 TaxID=3154953 RepID=UPI003445B475
MDEGERSGDELTAALQREVARYVEQGWSVDKHTATSVVLVKTRSPNRLLHAVTAVLGVLTLGGFSRTALGTTAKQYRVISVDETGTVHTQ